jgi:hypothetical protein
VGCGTLSSQRPRGSKRTAPALTGPYTSTSSSRSGAPTRAVQRSSPRASPAGASANFAGAKQAPGNLIVRAPAPDVARPRRGRIRSAWSRRIGRMVLTGFVVCASLARPALAQTNEACVLRCLDHGNLDQTCQARCTTRVPAAEAPKPRPAAPPANVPAAPVPQSPRSPAALSIPAPAAAPSAPQFLENQAPSPPAVQTSPRQSLRPPGPVPRPFNEACVLRCLDHGHLNEYCERICAH